MQRLLIYLRDLPTDMLHVLQLRFFEDKDFKEIAFIRFLQEPGNRVNYALE